MPNLRNNAARLCLFLAILAPASSLAAGGEDPRRPLNIVLILADDLGWRDTAVYGRRFYETPRIAQLAAEGMRFTDAYAASPTCSPTRASVLTGQAPARLRFTLPIGHLSESIDSASMPASGPPEHRAVEAPSITRLPDAPRILPEVLRDAGYATGFFGKWHLGWGDSHARHRGFDVVMPGGSRHAPLRYITPYSITGFEDGPPGEHLDERLASEAVGYVGEHRDEPFFLCFWPFSVHTPYQIHPYLGWKYLAKADPDDPQRNPRMGAMIETLDKSVGTLLDGLEEFGLVDRTVVIFLSDNGGVDWSEADQAPATSNLPLRGGKLQVYEGGVRVPLIVRWPGLVEAGAVSDAVVTSADLFSTILQIAGVEPEKDRVVDGASIVRAFEGKPLPERPIFSHFPNYGPSVPATAVRLGDWKLIRFYADGEGQKDRFELYDLGKDISESNDLATVYPGRVVALDRMIDRYLAETDALVPFRNPSYTADALADARAE